MSSYLPCGVTDSMCEPYDPSCANCGCPASNHYEEDGEQIFYESESLTRYSDAEGIELDASGEVSHACDSMLGGKLNKRQCGCTAFVEGEFEPEFDEDDWR